MSTLTLTLAMLVFLALYHFALTKALPLADVTTDGLSTRSPSSCNDLDECRKLIDIVWSCLTTIFACTWLTLHPNIPPPPPTEDMKFGENCVYKVKKLLRHQLVPFIVTLLAPEWILAWAMMQRIVANQIAEHGNRNIKDSNSTAEDTHKILEDPDKIVNEEGTNSRSQCPLSYILI
jgi:hypothetical protein